MAARALIVFLTTWMIAIWVRHRIYVGASRLRMTATWGDWRSTLADAGLMTVAMEVGLAHSVTVGDERRQRWFMPIYFIVLTFTSGLLAAGVSALVSLMRAGQG